MADGCFGAKRASRREELQVPSSKSKVTSGERFCMIAHARRIAKKTETLRYQIYLTPEPEGGFTVVVPALPGCITWGKNLEQAKAMAQDAIGAFLASMRKHGESVPTDEDGLLTSVRVKAVTRG